MYLYACVCLGGVFQFFNTETIIPQVGVEGRGNGKAEHVRVQQLTSMRHVRDVEFRLDGESRLVNFGDETAHFLRVANRFKLAAKKKHSQD